MKQTKKIETMKNMTKKEYQKFANDHGCQCSYSGKFKKHFIIKRFKININKLNELINSRVAGFYCYN